MAKSCKSQGICSTCNNASTCTYLKKAKQPVLQCEEYDGYAPSQEKAYKKGILPTDVLSGVNEKESGKFKGLCVDCENRKTCTFEKPEAGVWHCEEYK